MTRTVRFFLALGIALSNPAVVQPAQPAPQLPSVPLPPELDRVLRDYEREWSARNAAGLARLFAEDGFVLQPGRPPVRGRAAIERAYTGSGGKFILLLKRTRAGPWMIAADMDNSNQPRGPAPPPPPSPSARLDHVILYTGSLTQGMAEFARLTGVTPAVGGEHPGRGTRNALVSLGGGSYLELLAPTADSGAALPLLPYGWAVGTDDISQVAAHLRALGMTVSDPIPGSRRKPDGDLLSWRVVSLSSPSPSIPFFIEWGKEVRHPSATSPSGCALETFTIIEPEPAMLRALVETLRLPVTLREGAERRMSLTLRCPNGPVTFAR
ncbi:MAG: VOC family protein [Gemmatimonadales bacterium]